MSKQEKIGRGHPPVHRQFGRGQKRASGRPKGALGEKAIVQKIAGELHEIRERAQVTTYELLLKTMRNLAMSADLRAAKWLSDYARRKIPDPDDGVGFLVVPETMPEKLFIEQMMLRNRFATNPELNEDPLFASDPLQNRSARD
ncbi:MULTISPECIES: DUF5681 domain-containing protein [Bradyrhizobium]|uniref:DUF5681 domain-containing protein n=1 Tax=Bradyrhizobium elkanii TaxID=29448 RepID=UPI000404D637|nr:DUF5681 domain-containing protein [Bradyrhizobium elkanii]